jgi:hypothetical protein
MARLAASATLVAWSCRPLRSSATWGNGGSHSGSWWFHGKDGVAGSIPAGAPPQNHQLRPGPTPGLLHARRAPNRHLPEICQRTPSVAG